MFVPEKHNHDPAYRPTNAALYRRAVFACIFSGLFGLIAGAVLYVFVCGFFEEAPIGGFSVFYGIVGLITCLGCFFHFHYAAGRNKRIQYVAAGGDDSGMTDWMLGSLGGHVTENGQWEWNYPDTSGSGGDYV